MAVRNFEDLECWKSARELVRLIFVLTMTASFSHLHDLRWQLQKAALSTMNNIAEDFDRFSVKERMQFLNYSSGSAGEVRSMLYVCLDLELLYAEEFEQLIAKARKTQRLTVGLIRYMRKSQEE